MPLYSCLMLTSKSATDAYQGMRAGFVGLDTSHPPRYAGILRTLGVELSAVFDCGLTRGSSAAKRFTQEYGVKRLARSALDVAADCDLVFVNSADWNAKPRLVSELTEAGVSVFVDKPLGSGNQAWRRYAQIHRNGARVSGGSALQWLPAEGQHDAVEGYFLSSGHVYDYGIHAVALAIAHLGSDIAEITRSRMTKRRLQFSASWTSGKRATILVDFTGPHGSFGGWTRATPNAEPSPVTIDTNRLQRHQLEECLPYLFCAQSVRWSVSELCMPERVIHAAIASARSQRAIAVRTHRPSPFDSTDFVAQYRASVGTS